VSRHPDAALAGYAAGDLAGDERQRLEAHLADCAACRESVAEYRTLLAELAATAAAAAPTDTIAWPRYRAELRARLATRRAPPWRARWLRPLPVAASAAAAAALALVVYAALPTAPGGELAAMEYDGLAARLPLIDQYRVVEQLELLEDLDVIRNLDRLGGTREG